MSEVSISKLHPIERNLLKYIRELGDGLSPQLISEKYDLNEDKISKGVEWLREKGLLELEEEVEEEISFTKLGEKYLDIGLPEVRFLETVKEGTEKLSGVREKLTKNEFNAALGILKEKGLIEISDGKVILTEEGESKEDWKISEVLESLKDVNHPEELDKKLMDKVDKLEERNLVEIDVKVIKKIHLTDEGKEVSEKIGDEEVVDQLTSKMLRDGTWKDKKFRDYNIQAPAPNIYPGRKQPYQKFLNEVKQKLTSLGFQEMKSPIIDSAFFNCDALYMPQNHPAREIHDIFYLQNPRETDLSNFEDRVKNVKNVHEDGWETGSDGWGYDFDREKSKRLLLRSQTTNASVRKLLDPDINIPGKYFTVGRIFRPDVIDWEHLIEFDQIDGIILGEGITFRHLLGVLKMFAEEIAKVDKYKFTPAYFPFTEPSVELHGYLEGKGWVELGGAGMLRPEVTLPMGIEVPVIAWGLGISRLYMMRNNIKDIRKLYSHDLNYLRNVRER